MTKSERKMAMREEAKRKIKGGGVAPGANRAYGDAVEQGRRQLMIKSSQGGDSNISKIKSELTFLLNNYLPRYDMQIEALIDRWRRSGDPSYTPEIKSRLRRARKEHMNKSHHV